LSSGVGIEDFYPGADLSYRATSGFVQADREREDVTWVVMHTTEGHIAGDLTALTTGSASAHYLIDRTGKVYQLVANSDIAYHAGNLLYNRRSIGIELSRYGDEVVTSQQYQAAARIVE
jgi:N-acetyl-anhydromuramyl-L-alanine amidase AmpD